MKVDPAAADGATNSTEMHFSKLSCDLCRKRLEAACLEGSVFVLNTQHDDKLSTCRSVGERFNHRIAGFTTFSLIMEDI